MATSDLDYGKDKHYFGGIQADKIKIFSGFFWNDKDNGVRMEVTIEVPDNTTIDSFDLSNFEGVKVVKKAGSKPVDEFDGEVVTFKDISGNNVTVITESGTYYDYNVTLGLDYFYRAFSFTDQGVYNRNKNIYINRLARAEYCFGFVDDMENLNSETKITYIEDNKDFLPAHSNITTGTMTDGSWLRFLERIHNNPFMVNGTTCEADYELDHYNYNLRKDGSGASDITNVN